MCDNIISISQEHIIVVGTVTPGPSSLHSVIEITRFGRVLTRQCNLGRNDNRYHRLYRQQLIGTGADDSSQTRRPGDQSCYEVVLD